MEDLAVRIRSARKRAGLTQKELADRVGVTKGAVSQWENGLTQNLKLANLYRLAQACACDPEWIVTGAGDMEAANTSPGPEIRGMVPEISWVQAGQWSDISDPFEPGDGDRMVAVTRSVGPRSFALRVQGDSMEPMFPEGAVIIIDPDTDAENGSYVVARVNGSSEATFKQLVRDGGLVYLKPLNPRYRIIEVDGDAEICGVVKQMVMDF